MRFHVFDHTSEYIEWCWGFSDDRTPNGSIIEKLRKTRERTDPWFGQIGQMVQSSINFVSLLFDLNVQRTFLNETLILYSFNRLFLHRCRMSSMKDIIIGSAVSTIDCCQRINLNYPVTVHTRLCAHPRSIWERYTEYLMYFAASSPPCEVNQLNLTEERGVDDLIECLVGRNLWKKSLLVRSAEILRLRCGRHKSKCNVKKKEKRRKKRPDMREYVNGKGVKRETAQERHKRK